MDRCQARGPGLARSPPSRQCRAPTRGNEKRPGDDPRGARVRWVLQLVDGERSHQFGHAVDDSFCGGEPLALAGLVGVPDGGNRADEVSAIRGALAERYRPMVDLGAGCGMRQGEIFGLGVDDVDLDSGWVHIVRQVKVVRSRLVFGLPKNDRDRRVPLPDSVVQSLKEHTEKYDPLDHPAVGGPVQRRAGDRAAALHHHPPGCDQAGHLRRQELASGGEGGWHRPDPGDRDARAAPLLRLGAARRGGEHQGARFVPWALRPWLHAPGLYPPHASE